MEQFGLKEGYVRNGDVLMEVAGRKIHVLRDKIKQDKLLAQSHVKYNQDERIIRRYANHPIVGWAFTDEDGKVYDDMYVAMARGLGAIKATPYLLREGLVGFFSHQGIDFDAFFETEFKPLQEENGVAVEFDGPHNMGKCITNQAGFDLLYGLQHSERYVSSVHRQMGDAKFEVAQGAVREICVYFLQALPKEMQHDMDCLLPNGWWIPGGVFY